MNVGKLQCQLGGVWCLAWFFQGFWIQCQTSMWCILPPSASYKLVVSKLSILTLILDCSWEWWCCMVLPSMRGRMGNNLESFPRLVQLIISMVFTGLIAAIWIRRWLRKHHFDHQVSHLSTSPCCKSKILRILRARSEPYTAAWHHSGTSILLAERDPSYSEMGIPCRFPCMSL